MSHLYHRSKEDADFEAWLDEGDWIKYPHGDLYECAGGHVWHQDDVQREYEEAKENGWKCED